MHSDKISRARKRRNKSAQQREKEGKRVSESATTNHEDALGGVLAALFPVELSSDGCHSEDSPLDLLPRALRVLADLEATQNERFGKGAKG